MDSYKKGFQMEIRIPSQFIDTLEIILGVVAALSAIITLISFFFKRNNTGGSKINSVDRGILYSKALKDIDVIIHGL